MLNKKKKSIVLVQGLVEDSLFDRFKKRKAPDIFILEGRPNLEPAKTLSKSLAKRHVTPTLIADNMAGVLFYKNFVKEVWLSYQSSDGKGATCDVGALILAVLGRRHKVPVYLYPADRKTKKKGSQQDVLQFNGVRTAPKGVKAYAPLTDWVPNLYITKIYPTTRSTTAFVRG